MNRKVCLYLGLIIGVVVDGILRLTSGDEGNLLVHAAVFLGSAVIAMLVIGAFSVSVFAVDASTVGTEKTVKSWTGHSLHIDPQSLQGSGIV